MNIKSLIQELCPEDGLQKTSLEFVDLYRTSQPYERVSTISTPAICFVAQGGKNVYLGEKKITYDAKNYLISSVKVPVESELIASQEAPYLGLILHIDPTMVNELLIEMNDYLDWGSRNTTDEIISSSPVSEDIEGSVIRLLSGLQDPMTAKVLGESLVREVFFNILRSESGHLLRNSVLHHSKAHRVVPVIQYLEQHFKESVEIRDIASHVGMSPSALHDHFKSATSLSPLQFVKKLRLHHAYGLILEGVAIGVAAFESGYSSQAQFSREFKRQFGFSPRAAK